MVGLLLLIFATIAGPVGCAAGAAAPLLLAQDQDQGQAQEEDEEEDEDIDDELGPPKRHAKMSSIFTPPFTVGIDFFVSARCSPTDADADADANDAPAPSPASSGPEAEGAVDLNLS